MNPFSGLWNWFAEQAIPFLEGLCKRLIEGFYFNLRSLWAVVSALWALCCGLCALTLWSIDKISASLVSLDLSALSTPSASMIQYYAFIDRFVPLTEAISGAVICFNVWLVVVLIRWVKSVIPTVSN